MVPQQENCDDCGVFLMGFAEELAQAGCIKEEWLFQQSQASPARARFAKMLNSLLV